MHNLLRSFGYALNGLKLGLKERNFKIQVAFAIISISLGFLFNISGLEWCIILLCMALVFSLEMMNTAIERTVDYISIERNEKAAIIKDIAAGAVFIASVAAAAIGIFIFGKHIIALF